MNGAALTFAFSAGMVAAINPCGFALLPAYLSYYLGLESATGPESAATGTGTEAPSRSGPQPVIRALSVSAAMTAGFVLVFGLIGVVWTSVSSAIGHRLPWVVVGVGVALVVLGVAMLFGFVPVVRIPKMSTSSGSQSALSAFIFGVSYGVASLSCAIGPFIAAVTTTFRQHNLLDGFMTLLMYALGMGVIIGVLTLAVTFAKVGIINRLRSLIPHMTRLSGVLLIISGFVAIYFGWYEARILTGATPDNSLGRLVTSWRDWVAEFIHNTGEVRIGVIVAIVVLAALSISLVLRHATPPETDAGDSSPAS